VTCANPDDRIAIFSATIVSSAESAIFCQHSQLSTLKQPNEDQNYGGMKEMERNCDTKVLSGIVMSKCHGKSKSFHFNS
jgi:hypothetical protein